MKRYGWTFLAAALLCAAAARDLRAEVRAGIEETLGNFGYKNTDLSVEASSKLNPDDENSPSLSFKPEASEFSSNQTTGTSKSIQGRLGYDGPAWSAGATLERAPLNDGYSNTQWGADLAYSWTIGAEPGKGQAVRQKAQADEDASEEAAANEQAEGADDEGGLKLSLGGSWLHTRHTDAFQTVSRVGLTTFYATRRSVVIIGQNDYGADASASYRGVKLGGSYTVSKYNQDLAAISARSAPRVRLAGLHSLVQGFPHDNSSLRLDYLGLPVVSPYVSYTRTRFELGLPSSSDYTAGAVVELGSWEFSAAYDTLRQDGYPNLNHLALGAEYRF